MCCFISVCLAIFLHNCVEKGLSLYGNGIWFEPFKRADKVPKVTSLKSSKLWQTLLINLYIKLLILETKSNHFDADLEHKNIGSILKSKVMLFFWTHLTSVLALLCQTGRTRSQSHVLDTWLKLSQCWVRHQTVDWKVLLHDTFTSEKTATGGVFWFLSSQLQ